MRHSAFLGFGLLLLLVALSHCAPPTNACTPHLDSACPCPGGFLGVRSCLASGTPGACVCKAPSHQTDGNPTSRTEPPKPQEPLQEPQSTEQAGELPVSPEPLDTGSQEPGTPEPLTEPSTPDRSPVPDTPVAPDASGPDQPLPREDDGSCLPVCGVGAVCSQGKCLCPTGQSHCTNYCADLSYDAYHCGTCGNACGKGLTCVKKKCQCFYSKLIDQQSFACGNMVGLHFSAGGKRMISNNRGGGDCKGKNPVFDQKTRKVLHTPTYSSYGANESYLSHDGQTVLLRQGFRFSIYVIGKSTSFARYDISSTKKTTTTSAVFDPRPTSHTLAIGDNTPNLNVFQHVGGKTTRLQKLGLPDIPRAIAFSYDGKNVAVAMENKELQLYDTATYKVTQTWKGLANTPASLRYNRASSLLAIGMHNNTIELRDASKGTLVRTIRFSGPFHYAVPKMVFSLDDKTLFSHWNDKTIKIHDVATGRLLHTLPHPLPIGGFGLAADGSYLAVASGNIIYFYGCP